jgi:hypothetical protein
MVAYRELARGHDWRLQSPVTLCSLRQKVCFEDFWCLPLPGSLSLKEQNCWLMICQTISSDAMVFRVGRRKSCRVLKLGWCTRNLFYFGPKVYDIRPKVFACTSTTSATTTSSMMRHIYCNNDGWVLIVRLPHWTYIKFLIAWVARDDLSIYNLVV